MAELSTPKTFLPYTAVHGRSLTKNKYIKIVFILTQIMPNILQIVTLDAYNYLYSKTLRHNNKLLIAELINCENIYFPLATDCPIREWRPIQYVIITCY